MAEAKTDPTRNWLLIIEDVFSAWRDRLGSSKEAAGEVKTLLCDRETSSAIHKVDASGEEIPGTRNFADPEFWRDRLSLERDPDGGHDRLAIDYSESIYSTLPDGHWEGFVRALDKARWERLYPELAAPSPPPPASQTAPDQQPEDKAGPDPSKIEANHPPAAPPSTAAAPAVSEVATQDVSREAQSVESTPPKKAKRETQHDRLINLMKERQLPVGMLPRDVRTDIEQPYKKKHRVAAPPSPSAITRAYNEYEGALTNYLRGMPADLSKFYPATPTYEWLNLAVD